MPKRKKKKTTKNAMAKAKPKQRAVTFDEFKSFIRDNLCTCEYIEGGHLSPTFPTFDLMPRDYLAYANEALANSTDADKINCIAHLKRAAECQADTLLHILSLSSHAKTRNFPCKMNTIGALDLMPSRSIAELNRVRNKMEHEYAVPRIDDLNLYFDLVAGFVSAVEGAIFMLVCNGDMCFRNELDGANIIVVRVEYRPQEPELICEMSDAAGNSICKVCPDDWHIWMESLRVFFLLCRYDRIISHEHFLKHLDR